MVSNDDCAARVEAVHIAPPTCTLVTLQNATLLHPGTAATPRTSTQCSSCPTHWQPEGHLGQAANASAPAAAEWPVPFGTDGIRSCRPCGSPAGPHIGRGDARVSASACLRVSASWARHDPQRPRNEPAASTGTCSLRFQAHAGAGAAARHVSCGGVASACLGSNVCQLSTRTECSAGKRSSAIKGRASIARLAFNASLSIRWHLANG
jgi:hypothetical protein